MKYVFLIVVFMLPACAQLQHGATQPVIQKNVKDRIYFTSCSGAVEVWGNCYDKAKGTCANGYNITLKKEEINGGRRELTFQCNK